MGQRHAKRKENKVRNRGSGSEAQARGTEETDEPARSADAREPGGDRHAQQAALLLGKHESQDPSGLSGQAAGGQGTGVLGELPPVTANPR